MIKKIMGLALLLLATFGVSAQQNPELPLNPDVKHGTLPNGMQYFILHNSEPKERANFYIAQKVGSTLESEDQLGLAHFLEHMAFNGTSHYPGKAMLNYLQSKGIRFGADINAYTSFDETVYNINNVPTTDQALMDSVLLAIHDWSCEISLETDEINAERGVIEEEWRSRNSANSRMIEAVLPKIYKEYQYQQTPIGKMEVVRNFDPDVLRAYYKKWYRPDQQGIVIVGDFDAAEMEKKVIDLFSPIVMPENAAERVYPTVSDNKEPIFVYFEDPETQYPRLDLAFKTEKTPWEMRNTLLGFVQDKLVEAVIAKLINNRLDEFAQDPSCKYAQAVVYYGDFWVSKTKSSFNLVVIGKTELKEAFNQAIGIVARACKTGFSDTELARVRDEIIAAYEKKYNERNNTNSVVLANQLIRHFVDNAPNPGAETEYQLVKQMLESLPVEAYNQTAKEILTPENQVMVISQPKKDDMAVVTQDEMIPLLENSINAEYEAYVDEVITDPLLKNIPAPGKIVNEQKGAYGSTVMTLSNGAKVVVKPTDFKADEIRFTAFRNGGKRSYPESQAANIQLIEDAYNCASLGNFNTKTLKKYLAGKNVGLGFEVANTVNEFSGMSSVKDLPTLMELVYASFTELGEDRDAYNSAIDQARTAFKNHDSNPQIIFRKHLYKALYGNNPMFNQPDLATLDAANYTEMLNMIKETTANAAEFTFVFVGNVNVEELKGLLEKYIATLPGNKATVKKPKSVTSLNYVKGIVEDNFKQKMSSPVTNVYDLYSGNNMAYTPQNVVMMDMVGKILRIIYTETLREEMGATYSPYASANLNPNTKQWSISYSVDTNDEVLPKLLERAEKELSELLKNGAPEVHFNKVKEANIKQYEIAVRTNSYWEQAFISYLRGFDTVSGYEEVYKNVTLNQLNSFMKKLNINKNRVQVIMIGEKAE